MDERLQIYSGLKYDEGLPVADALYHYIGNNTLNKILKNGAVSLRLTRYDCFIDKTERKNILSDYRRTVNSIYYEGKIDKTFFKALKHVRLMDSGVFAYDDGEVLRASVKHKTIYVFCFTLSGNSDYMWRHYTKNRKHHGYNLCFSTIELNEGLNQLFGNGMSGEIRKVKYGKQAKKKAIQELILEQFAMVQEGRKKIVEAEADIQYVIDKWAIFYKKRKYQKENEVRMVIECDHDEGKHKFMIFSKDVLVNINNSPYNKQEAMEEELVGFKESEPAYYDEIIKLFNHN